MFIYDILVIYIYIYIYPTQYSHLLTIFQSSSHLAFFVVQPLSGEVEQSLRVPAAAGSLRVRPRGGARSLGVQVGAEPC